MPKKRLVLIALFALPAFGQDGVTGIETCRSIREGVARLDCYDAIRIVEAEPDENELIYRSLDAAIARELRDPSSAAQYAVSEVADCKQFEMAGYIQGQCVCYEINARNAYGGMVGVQMNFAKVEDGVVKKTLANGIATDHNRRICRLKPLKPRDASLIRAFAR